MTGAKNTRGMKKGAKRRRFTLPPTKDRQVSSPSTTPKDIADSVDAFRAEVVVLNRMRDIERRIKTF